ncbi:hypothetical protein H8959_020706 [Pygathrix nigripes]
MLLNAYPTCAQGIIQKTVGRDCESPESSPQLLENASLPCANPLFLGFIISSLSDSINVLKSRASWSLYHIALGCRIALLQKPVCGDPGVRSGKNVKETTQGLLDGRGKGKSNGRAPEASLQGREGA